MSDAELDQQAPSCVASAPINDTNNAKGTEDEVRAVGSAPSGPADADKSIEASKSDDDNDDSGAKPSAARRPVAFHPNHALKFGLEVVVREQTPSGSHVTAALCLFCKHFGREPKVGAKRRATTNFKYFKGVFRTDQYLQHHRLQHPVKWAEYEAASVREKQSFFPRYVIPSVDTVVESTVDGRGSRYGKAQKQEEGGEREDTRRGSASSTKRVCLSGGDGAVHPVKRVDTMMEIQDAVVCLFLGDSEWKPAALTTSKRSAEEETRDVSYRVTVPDPLALAIAADLAASGLSIAQTTETMHTMAKYVSGGATIASVWGSLVESYVELATFASVNLLSKLLSKCWALSLGIHASTTKESVEVRVRFFSEELHDLHLVQLPIHGPNDTVARVLDVLCPSWPKSLISISVDGDVFSSTELLPTIAPLRTRAQAENDFPTLTWNGSALLHRAFHELFHSVMGGAFAEAYEQLRWLVKSETQLIQEIGHEPNVPNKRRQNAAARSLKEILSITRWFTEKRMRIRKHFEDTGKPTPCPESWWLCLAAFDWIGSLAEAFATSTKEATTTQSSQEQVSLISAITTSVKSAFHLTTVDANADSNAIQYKVTNGSCAASKTGVLEFIVDLGSFVNSLLSSFKGNELDEVLESLGRSVATFAETLDTGLTHANQYLADANTASPSFAFPILPQEMAKLSGRDFSGLVSKYQKLLSTKFSAEQLDTMEQEHHALKRAMRERESRSEKPSSTSIQQFDDAWARTLGRFRLVHAFAGGLATIVVQEQRGARSPPQPHSLSGAGASDSLLDFNVEIPLHTAQFSRLQTLTVSARESEL